jgi:SAM-dependent methyltransferase
VIITAVDPLAHQYESLFAELNMTPPVRTQSGAVESLTERFPADYFDLVNVQNALDHSYDPLVGIRQMLQVVKSGCYVLLLHTVNEAESMSYAGFHQWNFCADNGDFVIWNREIRLCVNEVLGDEAKVTVRQSEADQQLLISLRKTKRKPTA